MIFSTIQDLKQWVNVTQDLDLDSIAPFEMDVRAEYLSKWFSSDLIAELESYSGEAAGSAKLQAHNYLMSSFARLMLLKFIPSAEVTISELGIVRNENENVKTAYSGQVKALQQSLEDSAFRSISALVDLMNANTGDFTNWDSSPGYTLNSELLIRSASEFELFQKLYRPFTTFLELIPNIETAQDLYISSWISSTLLQELITNNNLGAEKKKLRKDLQKALAHFTLSESIEKGLVKLSKDGVRFIAEDKDTSHTKEEAPDLHMISRSIRKFTDIGHAYISKAKQFMAANENIFGEADPEPTRKQFFV